MKKILLIVLVVMLNVSGLSASDPGSTGANFLKINLAPRELAMGSVGIGLADGPGAMFTNPAGLGSIGHQSLSFFYNIWLEGMSAMGAGFYDLSDVYAYPVPYKPNDGLSTTGDETSGIIFTNLSTEAEIKIYTITGELVKKLTHKGGFVEEWYPVENEKGKRVASGVYVYYINNYRQHKSGKLMIIR